MLIFDSRDGKDLYWHEGIIRILDVGVFCFLQTLEVELVQVDPCGSSDDLHSLLALVYAVAVLQAHSVVLAVDLGDDRLQLALWQLVDADELVKELE